MANGDPEDVRHSLYHLNDDEVLGLQPQKTVGFPADIPAVHCRLSVSGAGTVVVVFARGTVVVTGSWGPAVVGVGCSPGVGTGVVGAVRGTAVVTGLGAAAGGSHGGGATVVGVGTDDGGASDVGVGTVTPGSAVFSSRGWGLLGSRVIAAAAAAAVNAATGPAATSTRARRVRVLVRRGASASSTWSMFRRSASSLATNTGLGSGAADSSRLPSSSRNSDVLIAIPFESRSPYGAPWWRGEVSRPAPLWCTPSR